MPGRVLKELPAYSHVPINHKTSPRGRIKLSVPLCLLSPSPSLTCGPTGCITKASACLFTSSLQYSDSPSLSPREPRMWTESKSCMRLSLHKLPSAKHDLVVGNTTIRPFEAPAKFLQWVMSTLLVNHEET